MFVGSATATAAASEANDVIPVAGTAGVETEGVETEGTSSGVAGAAGAGIADVDPAGSGTPDTATPPWLEQVPRPSERDQVPSRQVDPANAAGATRTEPDSATTTAMMEKRTFMRTPDRSGGRFAPPERP